MPPAASRSEHAVDAVPGPSVPPLIVVWLGPGVEDHDVLASLESVAASAPDEAPLVLVGTQDELEALAVAVPFAKRVARPGRVLEQLDAASRAEGARDLVLLRAGVMVSDGWIEGLTSAAHSDTVIASSTPLSLGSGGVEVARGYGDAAGDDRGEDELGPLAQALRRRAELMRPRVTRIGPASVYLRRDALELLGGFGEADSVPLALARLAARGTRQGLLHVAADDVLVDCRPAQTPDPEEGTGEVTETVELDERSPLRRARSVARSTVFPLSVTIDGRSLVSAYGGTQTYVLGLVRALAEVGATTTRVLVPPDLSPRAQRDLDDLDSVEVVSYDDIVSGRSRSEVVHRPQQVFSVDDLNLLRLAGEHVVVSQLDLIAYHNPAYHPDLERWRAYRRVTLLALTAADRAVFFSEHARRDALAEDLVEAHRTSVIGIGPTREDRGEERRPAAVGEEERFLLCLGADYAHKNRPFAIELQGELARLGWEGRLVLAGPQVPHGSSRERERDLLASDTDVAERVLDLGPVGEEERRWLLARARALVYPSVYEGYGLIPVEASEWGLPCLFAAVTSLADFSAAATLVPWDAAMSATATITLLEPGAARDEHLRALRALQVPSWPEIAAELVSVYAAAAAGVPAPGAERAWQELDRERVIVEMRDLAQEYQDAYHELEGRVAAGLPLIDEGGLLSPSQQQGLMRIASRRAGRAALAPLELLGRLSTRSQRG